MSEKKKRQTKKCHLLTSFKNYPKELEFFKLFQNKNNTVVYEKPLYLDLTARKIVAAEDTGNGVRVVFEESGEILLHYDEVLPLMLALWANLEKDHGKLSITGLKDNEVL